MTTLLTRMLRARTRFSAPRYRNANGRPRRHEVPVPVWQVLIYGVSVALVVGLGVWLWR